MECTLQFQTGQRRRGLPLDWDEDLARLAGDRSLSTDHKVRVGVHQGNELNLLSPRMAASLQDAVQGVRLADGEDLGGGQERVPSPGGLYANAHEAGEEEDAAIESPTS